MKCTFVFGIFPTTVQTSLLSVQVLRKALVLFSIQVGSSRKVAQRKNHRQMRLHVVLL